ncbi:MAG: tetratricopeptide repeat protein [Bacillota bacterium]
MRARASCTPQARASFTTELFTLLLLAVVGGGPLVTGEAAGDSGAGSRVDWKAVIESNKRAGPGELEAHLYLAVGYANLGMIREATQEFRTIESAGYREFGQEVIGKNERIVKENPVDILSLNMLAFAYYAFGDYKGSALCFERLVGLDPKNVWVHHYFALSLSRAGELDRAIEVLRAALTLDPSNDYTHLLLGLAYKEKGWYVLSILELARAGKAVRELATLR